MGHGPRTVSFGLKLRPGRRRRPRARPDPPDASPGPPEHKVQSYSFTTRDNLSNLSRHGPWRPGLQSAVVGWSDGRCWGGVRAVLWAPGSCCPAIETTHWGRCRCLVARQEPERRWGLELGSWNITREQCRATQKPSHNAQDQLGLDSHATLDSPVGGRNWGVRGAFLVVTGRSPVL